MKYLLLWLAVSLIAVIFFALLMKGASMMDETRCSTCEHSLALSRGLELPVHLPKMHYSMKMGNHEMTAQGFAGWDVIISRPLNKPEIDYAIEAWTDGDYNIQTLVSRLPEDVEVLFQVTHKVQE